MNILHGMCLLYMTQIIFKVVSWYHVVVCASNVCSEDIWFPDNDLSFSEWISMKFIRKVQYHKREVGIVYEGDGPNCLGIRS